MMHKVQREITPKVSKAELPFLHSARHLILIDICIKFREYSLSGFQVIERTRFVTERRTDRRTDRQTPGENNMSPDPKGGRHNHEIHVLFEYGFYLKNPKLRVTLHGKALWV